MRDNRELVRELIQERLLPSACDPSTLPAPRPGSPDWSRVEGMLLGLALGDALGNTSESSTPADRAKDFGEIRDYQQNRYADFRRVGLPSDDTQLAFWTLDRLLRDGGLDAARLSDDFSDGRHILGIGSSVKAFLANRKRGVSWREAGAESAGNGALMRIAPVIVPHLRAPSTALWADAALAGAVTHRDYASVASCVAFTNLLWELLLAEAPPARGWWTRTFCEVAARIEGEERRYTPRAPAFAGERVSLWSFTEREVSAALARGASVVEACDRWHSGAFLLETVPSVLYILEKHGADAEEAIVRAVNDTWDNDTVAAIVGAAVGALHGVEALPKRWRSGLIGRMRQSDDGAIFRLLEDAKR